MMAKSESQIGFDQVGLGSVLKQYQLSVPPNQRDYSWTDKEVTNLLQDFAKCISDGDNNYFLGTIVTIPRQNGILEVVDGQQRLATTAIFLSSIRDYLKEIDEDVISESVENEFLTGIDRQLRERKPKISLNLDDNDFFRSIITNDENIPKCIRPSHEKIKEASRLCNSQVKKIVSKLDKMAHGDELNQWIQFIENKALVILLRVPNSVNAYKMFETLNDRGLRTSQSDLVKNYLYGKAGDRIKEVQHFWTLMKGTLESLDDEDISINYLRHSLIVIHGFVRQADIYNVVQKVIKSERSALKFISNLELLSISYVAIHTKDHEKWNEYSDSTRKAIEVANLLNIKPFRPLMLSVSSMFTPIEAAKAFQLFISISVRLLISGFSRSGSIEQTLAQASHNIYLQKIVTKDELLKGLKSIILSDDQFLEAFKIANVGTAKFARYYLRSLEMAAKEENEPWQIPNDDKQIINLEHILPRKPENNWPNFDDDQLQMYGGKLGNLCLLQATSNSNLKSSAFNDKKHIYKNSPYLLTKQIADATVWGPSEIIQRQEIISQYALKAWAL